MNKTTDTISEKKAEEKIRNIAKYKILSPFSKY